MAGWHHRFYGHEFKQASGDSEEQSLVCCSSWGLQELDMTERLSNKKRPGLSDQGLHIASLEGPLGPLHPILSLAETSLAPVSSRGSQGLCGWLPCPEATTVP